MCSVLGKNLESQWQTALKKDHDHPRIRIVLIQEHGNVVRCAPGGTLTHVMIVREGKILTPWLLREEESY